MTRLLGKTGTLPFIGGIVAATTLSTAAVLTVTQAGCSDPGRFEIDGHQIELVGGCVQPEDLPVTPQRPHAPPPLGESVRP